MADEETRIACTAGISGTFHVGDLTITPEGTEITQTQWEEVVAPAAAENRVIVRLNEDFRPRALQKQDSEETDVGDDGSENKEDPKADPDPVPVVPVETADANQGTAVDGQAPAPGTGTGRSARKGS